MKSTVTIDSNSKGVPMDSIDDDEPRRSVRLQKPRRLARLNKVSWIDDDLEELKYFTYSDDRVYQHANKTHIVPIESSEGRNVDNDKIDNSINHTTNHISSTTSSGFCVNPSSTRANKIAAVAHMIFGAMMSSYPTYTYNETINIQLVSLRRW